MGIEVAGKTALYFACYRLLPLVSIVGLSSGFAASESERQWHNLKGLEKSNVYSILLRDNTCRSGRISNVQVDGLMLDSAISIARSEVMFVGEGFDYTQVLFSRRSSWEDVRNVDAKTPESLRVWLKAGPSLSGAKLESSGSDVTIGVSGQPAKIPKDAIAQVDYIRFKPVSAAHRHFAQTGHGLQVFDPKAWQYVFRISALMSVRIYDSTLPEDNSPFTCINDSRAEPISKR